MSNANVVGCRGNSFGFINGAWQKNPILLGYSARIGNKLVIISTGAASTAVCSAVVPAGEIWVISSICSYHTDGVARQTFIYANLVTALPVIEINFSLPLMTSLSMLSPIILAEGDKICVMCVSLANGRSLTLNYLGYRIDIDL